MKPNTRVKITVGHSWMLGLKGYFIRECLDGSYRIITDDGIYFNLHPSQLEVIID